MSSAAPGDSANAGASERPTVLAAAFSVAVTPVTPATPTTPGAPTAASSAPPTILPAATVTPEPWSSLRRFTPARIALGRAGNSLPTAAHLAFQLAHAQARDAVHWPFDAPNIDAALVPLGLKVLQLHSDAPDRASYLQRPDWGRRLCEASGRALQEFMRDKNEITRGTDSVFDLTWVIADGLSALAVNQHAPALVRELLSLLEQEAQYPYALAPVCLVKNGRVAVGDTIGQTLRSKLVVVLIGERPGLSSPDSMGIYVTWQPHVGCTDAQRNCISNVRPAGLPLPAAAAKLHHLLKAARRLQLTGVMLKDEFDPEPPHLSRTEAVWSGSAGEGVRQEPPADLLRG